MTDIKIELKWVALDADMTVPMIPPCVARNLSSHHDQWVDDINIYKTKMSLSAPNETLKPEHLAITWLASSCMRTMQEEPSH